MWLQDDIFSLPKWSANFFLSLRFRLYLIKKRHTGPIGTWSVIIESIIIRTRKLPTGIRINNHIDWPPTTEPSNITVHQLTISFPIHSPTPPRSGHPQTPLPGWQRSIESAPGWRPNERTTNDWRDFRAPRGLSTRNNAADKAMRWCRWSLCCFPSLPHRSSRIIHNRIEWSTSLGRSLIARGYAIRIAIPIDE